MVARPLSRPATSALGALALLVSVGCEGPWAAIPARAPVEGLVFDGSSPGPRLVWPPPPREERPPPVTLATFNLQVFGPSKASRPDDVDALAAVIEAYDLVAVQEIKDISGVAPEVLAAALAARGAPHQMLLGPRTGTQPDDRRSAEQYAYFYDATRWAAVGAGALYDDSAQDLFQREPFVARFESLDGGLDLVLIDIHTKPTLAVEEIGALHQVVSWARTGSPGAGGVVVLGDFNAGCSYADPEELDALALRGPDYVWAVPDDADTNVAATACAYDRIVLDLPASAAWTGRWGVDRPFEDDPVSDHWPVWIELRAP